MPLKVKISDFSPVPDLNSGDLIPIIRDDGSKKNKNVTVLNLEQHILGLEDGSGIHVSGSSSITGSLILTGDLTIQGAILNTLTISSSQVNIGDNIILLNTLYPHQRYAGIEVYDSGSTNASSSFLWDGSVDTWGLSNLSASGFVSASTIRAATSMTSPIGNFTNLTASNISASGFVSASNVVINETLVNGSSNVASGPYSHAEGYYTTASAHYSHAEGSGSITGWDYNGPSVVGFASASHAEGILTRTYGVGSHAEGSYTYTIGIASHAEGNLTTASGISSHAEGQSTRAIGQYSHAEGNDTTANGNYSHAEGSGSIAGFTFGIESALLQGVASHAEGILTMTRGTGSHSEGMRSYASGSYSHAEGIRTTASGEYSHAEGSGSLASGIGSHAEGIRTTASGEYSHAEGYVTTALGNGSHAEGYVTYVNGVNAHAEGYATTASGNYSHAEGAGSKSSGSYSHAEGYETIASGESSHAEGKQTHASGSNSHAEGLSTLASGSYSHAEGQYTTASGDYQHVSGKYNVASANSNDLFIIGNGTSTAARSNILVVNTSSVIVSGNITSSNISASGDITMSGILVTGNSRIPIGEPSNPSDTVFTDGFFDTFTKQTKLADAIDEISEAFLDLAPPKAGVLTGTTLSSSGTNLYSAHLAAGLNPHWYSGSSQAGSLITTFINQPFLKLSTTQSSQLTASFFRSGKYSDFTVLTGGVTSSFSTGSNPVVVASSASILKSTGSIVSSSLAIGTGLLPSTFINGTNRYNIFWAQTSASISHSLTTTGSLNYALSADNSAGITNTSTYWFATDLATDYSDQTLSGVTCSIATPNLKNMSGMTYLSGSSAVKVSLTASNLHNPVYNTASISFVFSNPLIGTIGVTGSVLTPSFGDIIKLDTSVINSTANIASPIGTFPTLIITTTKPGKSNVSSAATTVYPRPVNNYGNPASVTTNDVNTITEKFLDEYYRVQNLQGTINTFPSASSLQDLSPFSLQVQNGRLIAGGVTVGVTGDYPSFTPGSSDDSYGNYFRYIIIPNSVQSGQLTMSLVSPFTTVQPWGSGNSSGPEIALIKTGEVLTAGSATNIYDLGRTFGSNSGNIIGAQDAGQSTLSSGRIKWTFGTQPTGINLILWIRYKNTVGYITDFTLKT